jgi:hypothetical protein
LTERHRNLFHPAVDLQDVRKIQIQHHLEMTQRQAVHGHRFHEAKSSEKRIQGRLDGGIDCINIERTIIVLTLFRFLYSTSFPRKRESILSKLDSRSGRE